MLLERRSGRASNAELTAILGERERAGRLELDSASFLHCAVEEVVRLYPEARFAFGWRPFDAWLDSLLGMLLDRGGGAGVAPEGERWSRWERAILALILGDFRAQWFAVPGAIDTELPRLAQAALEHWLGAMQRCLTLLPEGSLIFPTAELDHLAPAFAELAGVPAANVHPARDNVSPQRVTLWAKLPRGLRDEASERSAPLLELARRRGPASVTSA
jgi:hypothetical protein